MLSAEGCGSLHNNVCESTLQIVKGSGAAMCFHKVRLFNNLFKIFKIISYHFSHFYNFYLFSYLIFHMAGFSLL